MALVYQQWWESKSRTSREESEEVVSLSTPVYLVVGTSEEVLLQLEITLCQ